jgi:hypothetical protein
MAREIKKHLSSDEMNQLASETARIAKALEPA